MSSKLLSLQLFSAFNYFIIVYCSFQDTILAAHNIHRVNAALMELEWNTGMAREAGNEAGKLQAETMCEQIEEKHKQPGTYLEKFIAYIKGLYMATTKTLLEMTFVNFASPNVVLTTFTVS
ncbi:uncharacterized protein LOC142352570 isoform X5 [Convolutriloba macropyga]|uniref:uncharacterized protein LOC142352570 isoform X5 n=1 Tax=Convolutriloba macropyga TaxID=536237 RepID=UPI003F5269E9